MMPEATHRIGTREDRGQIFKTLSNLCLQSRRALENDVLTLEEAGELSARVANIRALLTELSRMEQGRCDGTAAALEELVERYQDLEGMVKEARNSQQTRNNRFVEGEG
jgi:hypothetical protein